MLLDSECCILSVIHVLEICSGLVQQVAQALAALHIGVLLVEELSHRKTVSINLQIVL